MSLAEDFNDQLEDEVLIEFDIVVNNQQNNNQDQNLLLFQYPLRPANRPYGDHGELNKVEITQGLKDEDNKSIDDQNYIGDLTSQKIQSFRMTYELFGGENQSNNDQFNNYDHKTKDNLIETHQLKSENIPQNDIGLAPNYFIGNFNNCKQLVLCPLNNFHQVRPSFDHVNEDKYEALPQYMIQKQKSNVNCLQSKKNEVQQEIEWQQIHEFDSNSNANLLQILNPQENEFDLLQNQKELSNQETNVKNDYVHSLAPLKFNAFAKEQIDNDFSTASIQRLQGPNITADILNQKCGKDELKMCYYILTQFPIMNLESLIRIIQDTNQSSNTDNLKMKLIDYLLQPNGNESEAKCYIEPITNNLILKTQYLSNQQYLPLAKQPHGTDPFIEIQMSWITKKQVETDPELDVLRKHTRDLMILWKLEQKQITTDIIMNELINNIGCQQEPNDIEKYIIQPLMHQFQSTIQSNQNVNLIETKMLKDLNKRQKLALQNKCSTKLDQLFIDNAQEEIASFFYSFMVREASQGFASINSIYECKVKSQIINDLFKGDIQRFEKLQANGSLQTASIIAIGTQCSIHIDGFNLDDRLFASQQPTEIETIIRDVIAIMTGQDNKGKGIKKPDIEQAVITQIGDNQIFDKQIFDRLLQEMCKISSTNICKLKPMFK